MSKTTICPHCGLSFEIVNPADAAIELYYRSRAAGSKTTLRKIAAQTNISYDYLRKVKQQYDKSGKWGSKKTHA